MSCGDGLGAIGSHTTKRQSRRLREDAGLTLVELLITLVVMAVAVTIVVPNLDALTSQGGDDRCLRLISAAVEDAQDIAIIKRESVHLTIDIGKRTAVIAGGAPIRLPGSGDIVISFEDGRRFSSGEVTVAIDEEGTVEFFELRIGARIKAVSNPITGRMEATNEA